MHRAKCLCVEEPLKDLWTALAQRIVQALLRSRAETVQRNTKPRNSNLRHMSVLLASEIYAIACPRQGHYEARTMNSLRQSVDVGKLTPSRLPGTYPVQTHFRAYATTRPSASKAALLILQSGLGPPMMSAVRILSRIQTLFYASGAINVQGSAR